MPDLLRAASTGVARPDAQNMRPRAVTFRRARGTHAPVVPSRSSHCHLDCRAGSRSEPGAARTAPESSGSGRTVCVEYALGELYDELTELCRFDDFEREGHPDEVRGDPLEGPADCHASET